MQEQKPKYNIGDKVWGFSKTLWGFSENDKIVELEIYKIATFSTIDKVHYSYFVNRHDGKFDCYDEKELFPTKENALTAYNIINKPQPQPQPKYNIDDTLWYIDSGIEATSLVIKQILLIEDNSIDTGINICYDGLGGRNGWYEEKRLYPTKIEALQAEADYWIKELNAAKTKDSK